MYTLHSSVYFESLFWRLFLMNYLYLSKKKKIIILYVKYGMNCPLFFC